MLPGRVGFRSPLLEPPQTPAGPMTSSPAPSAMGDAMAGGFQPPPVNVGVKFPVPPPVFQGMPPDPAMSGFGINNMAGMQNPGPALAQAQSPQTTYGFSSGNPGQLASFASTPHDNATLSALEQALRQQMGGF
jgi:hypothetical protein